MVMLKIAQVRLADADASRQVLLGYMADAAQVFDVAAYLTQAFFVVHVPPPVFYTSK